MRNGHITGCGTGHIFPDGGAIAYAKPVLCVKPVGFADNGHYGH